LIGPDSHLTGDDACRQHLTGPFTRAQGYRLWTYNPDFENSDVPGVLKFPQVPDRCLPRRPLTFQLLAAGRHRMDALASARPQGVASTHSGQSPLIRQVEEAASVSSGVKITICDTPRLLEHGTAL